MGCWQFWVAVSGFSVYSLHTAMLLLSLDADLLPQTKCMHVSLTDDYLFARSVDTNINGCGPAICTLPLPLDKTVWIKGWINSSFGSLAGTHIVTFDICRSPSSGKNLYTDTGNDNS